MFVHIVEKAVVWSLQSTVINLYHRNCRPGQQRNSSINSKLKSNIWFSFAQHNVLIIMIYFEHQKEYIKAETFCTFETFWHIQVQYQISTKRATSLHFAKCITFKVKYDHEIFQWLLSYKKFNDASIHFCLN